jgi:hypothetical protein
MSNKYFFLLRINNKVIYRKIFGLKMFAYKIVILGRNAQQPLSFAGKTNYFDFTCCKSEPFYRPELECNHLLFLRNHYKFAHRSFSLLLYWPKQWLGNSFNNANILFIFFNKLLKQRYKIRLLCEPTKKVSYFHRRLLKRLI